MYCKSFIPKNDRNTPIVLIVAKCIVNFWNDGDRAWNFGVLIVAKCIVNAHFSYYLIYHLNVLIVAKCIVNLFHFLFFY